MKEILLSTISGQGILKDFELNKTLSKNNRNALVGCICEFWLRHNQQINSKDFINATDEIVKLFPCENKVSIGLKI